MLRVLLIGLGSVGQRHVRNLRALLGDDVEINAFRTRGLTHVLTNDMRIAAAEGLHEAYDIHVFYDLDEALAKKPDAVFICNPNSLHLQFALAAARANCNLFIEKPVSHSYEGVEALASVIKQKHLVSFVAYQMRFHPCLQTVKNLLEENAIGPILGVRAEIGEYLPNWHPYEDYRFAYHSHREYGGGALLAQTHEIDYLYWFFGMPARVFCVGGHVSSLEIDVEDIASTLMEYEGDGYTFPVHLQQDYLQRPPSRTCQILGDRGKILVDLHALTVQVHDDKGNLGNEYDFRDFPRNQLFLDELSHFVACVRREEQSLIDVLEGAQSLRIALAAKESLESGKVVEVS